MENAICKKCGRELPLSAFKVTRWGTHAQVCNECVTSSRVSTISQKRKTVTTMYRDMRLKDFTPRELMEELARRGYEGKLTYTEVHEIDITNF